MRRALFLIMLAAPLQSACAQEPKAEQAATETAAAPVSDEDILRAAGFNLADGKWGKCGDPGTASYESGTILERGDFNGDGRPDALVTEGSTYCAGMTGYVYTLVSQQADGSWAILDERAGIPEFLATTGTDGWPDIEVGGPGFCFPVIRWNGSEFTQTRTEYEGKPCQG